MKIYRLYLPLLLFIGLAFASCEKEDSPIELPPRGDAQYIQVTMGEDYEDQIYFSFEQGPVMKSRVDMWDLAFETTPQGRHVYINGGKNVYVYNIGSAEMNAAAAMPTAPLEKWQFDMPDGDPARTAIGEWYKADGTTKGDVYVVRVAEEDYKKIRLVSADEKSYVMEYSDLNGGPVSTITIPKEDQYDYTYFSFEGNGAIVYPAPPKSTWDVVFTRYRYIYEDLDNFPYLVSGTLLNPYNTTAYVDSVNSYDAANMNNMDMGAFTNERDVIGFDWKIVSIDQNAGTAKYHIDDKKFYVVKTSKNEYWKLRFRDFYGKDGKKGSPAFEYIRIK